MQNFRLLLGAIVIGSMAGGLQSCKKDSVSPQNPATPNTITETDNTAARMWNPGRQLFGVGLKPGTFTTTFYRISAPPIGGLVPGAISGLFIGGGIQLTYASGVAFMSTDIIVSTSAASNMPGRLLTYAFGSYAAPTSVVSCPGITDIEFNEYDGRLYGILNNNRIVSITLGGAIAVNYAPPLAAGQFVKGLCNYNGLLSYCIADNTGAPDRFYAYNPAAPGATPVLFMTDWGLGDGGMQYCSGGFGWIIISETDTKKTVSPTPVYAVAGPAGMAGAPYMMTDLTSN
jgi:hypothetical protein